MNDALMTVVEKTTTDVLKLKELDKKVLKIHCGDRERNHQSRRDYRFLVYDLTLGSLQTLFVFFLGCKQWSTRVGLAVVQEH